MGIIYYISCLTAAGGGKVREEKLFRFEYCRIDLFRLRLRLARYLARSFIPSDWGVLPSFYFFSTANESG